MSASPPQPGQSDAERPRWVVEREEAREREIAELRPPFGCDCDPFDCGPAGHSRNCPAGELQRDWIWRNYGRLPRLDALIREMDAQDKRYGRFKSDVAGMRLAAAALEDEADEVKRAWRAERKVEGWPELRAEALQVAAVALRLVRDAEDAAN